MNADTGLFELVYRQNSPRPPAYLGTNLSIRGRRIFKGRKHKAKDQKNKENADIHPNSSLVLVDRPLKPYTPTIPPKSLCGTGYSGPVIEDLIEDLHKKFFAKTEGIEFYPSKEPIQVLAKKKNPKGHAKVERIQKVACNSPRNKLNRSNFAARNSANESGRRNRKQQRAMLVRSAYFGLFNDWKVRNKLLFPGSDHPKWEKDTNSILKGKNIQCLSNNKNFASVNRCLTSIANIDLDKFNKGSNSFSRQSNSTSPVEKVLPSAPTIKLANK